MSTKYFLVFLLGLVVMSTATTTEHGGSTAINKQRQIPFMNRFYSRGWATIKDHPSKSVEKSHEQPKLMHTGARKTMQKVEAKAAGNEECSQGAAQAMQNMEEKHRDKAAGCLRRQKNKNVGMPENRPTSFVRGVEKARDMAEGYRAKRTGTNKLDDMHQ